MTCEAKRLVRSPAGIPHGDGPVNPFPMARKCDLDCIEKPVGRWAPGVTSDQCDFTVRLFSLSSSHFAFVCGMGKGRS